MSQRSYTKYADSAAKQTLAELLTSREDQQAYRRQMTRLGEHLGDAVARELGDDRTIYVACTVEDADFLTSGLIDRLHGIKRDMRIYFACFWNQRETLGQNDKIEVAPVLRRYAEEAPKDIDSLILTKSIVSGTCVVRTNLLELMSKLSPTRIFVVAPVMYDGAEDKLREAFPEKISKKFTYITFAHDKVRLQSGEVQPGIGGSVYELLGLGDQQQKTHYRPKIVLQRRKAQSSLSST